MNLSKPIYVLWLTALSLHMGCRPKPSLAYLDANIINDNVSTRARVSFTNYQSVFSNNTLVATFSDDSGSSMTFELKGSGGNIPADAYNVDGSDNAFAAQLVVLSNSQSQTASLTGTAGTIEVASANVDGNVVKTFSGSFTVNFEGGGAGTGTFNSAD